MTLDLPPPSAGGSSTRDDYRAALAEVKAARSKARALRPWYRKRRIWLLTAIALVALGAATSRTALPEPASPVIEDPQDLPASPDAPAPAVEDETDGDDSVDSSETLAQANAREKATDYLAYMAFSRSGLIKQLEFEGFESADATYGVDALNADWSEQAAKKAQEYLDLSAFSRQGLIDQLVFEGFTPQQAEYGVGAVGL